MILEKQISEYAMIETNRGYKEKPLDMFLPNKL
ncbi:MAG: hypothetical protein RL154_1160 [Pseudomonadota bacterium]|jgi:hypothetical protein